MALGGRVILLLARDDAEGEPQVTAFTAACPHLGCAVEFNAANDRFECPCHLSKFAISGDVIGGPAPRPP